MRAIARSTWLALPALAALLVGGAFGQAPPPAQKGGAAPAQDKSAPNLDLKQTVATVNRDVITLGELINFLRAAPAPPPNSSPEQIYQDAVESLVNARLIAQYLDRQRVNVPEQKVDDEIAALKKKLEQNGSSLATLLARNQVSLSEVRKQFADQIRFTDYLNSKATPGELKKFYANHKDLFNGTEVRVSHIFLPVDPKASAEDKEKVRQKLLGIKKEIESGKITFAAAANKNSQDPANSDGPGGDIGYIRLGSGIVEEFANAAFALKKQAISDPVETPYGFHLIQVTDRKEGKDQDVDQITPLIKQVYGGELQKNILMNERKTAKIDIKPVPPGLFPPAPAGTPVPPGAAPPPSSKPAAPANPK